LPRALKDALPPSCPTSGQLAPKPRVCLMIAHRFRVRLCRLASAGCPQASVSGDVGDPMAGGSEGGNVAEHVHAAGLKIRSP
jgi:hypothetical protein